MANPFDYLKEEPERKAHAAKQRQALRNEKRKFALKHDRVVVGVLRQLVEAAYPGERVRLMQDGEGNCCWCIGVSVCDFGESGPYLHYRVIVALDHDANGQPVGFWCHGHRTDLSRDGLTNGLKKLNHPLPYSHSSGIWDGDY